MLPMVWNPFKSRVEIKKRASHVDGLKTLLENFSHNHHHGIIDNNNDSNVVVKSSTLKLIQNNFLLNDRNHANNLDSCFLKSCQLCNKTLSLDKEVYMYRGDQGFCSIECRERQIYVNEMKELETYYYTKKKWSSLRPCSRDTTTTTTTRGGRFETTSLLQEFQQRHKPFSPNQNPQVIFSLS